ncbi:MAG: response regulator, partial [Lachnospiraceae bacterium]|nr:response regulator [Lachnospiraceae bacterium]
MNQGFDSNIQSELLKKQKELEEAKEAAEAANKAKSNFLFNMSHDIRTPLNAIIGFTDLAIKRLDDTEKVREYLNNIHTSGEKLLDILNGVLEMARIESNDISITEDLIDTAQFLESCYVMFNAAFREKFLLCRIENNITHRYLYIDKVHVEEVLLNIISNAVKYTPEGGRIHIVTNELPGEKKGECLIEFSVEDNGIGMSKEFLSHAFDDFARERNEKTTNISGTGLGLPIVKRLVGLMNGTIRIESKLGKGTKVTTVMPHRIGTKRGLCNEHKAEINPELFRGRTILLAEDNDLNAEIAVEILRDVGMNVVRVCDGIECVRELNDMKAGTFDLILMDIQMP